MANVFPQWTNSLPKLVVGALLIGGTVAVFAVTYWFSPEYTDVGYTPKQPVPFSHKVHAGDLGLDCRYCHNSVETSSTAAIPPAATCMNCHRSVKADSKALAPIRAAAAGGDPVRWVRVHMLPDYAFFDHSVHVGAGVGCATCHGRIDQMEEVAQHTALSMNWCLDCHRHPEAVLRPRSEITNMDHDPAQSPFDRAAAGLRTVDPPEHCSGCHR